jgi:hypothetical protein
LVFSALVAVSLLVELVEHVGGWRVVNPAILPPVTLLTIWMVIRLRRGSARRNATSPGQLVG